VTARATASLGVALLLCPATPITAGEVIPSRVQRVHSRETCSAALESSTGVTLRDGSTVTVDPASVAVNGERVFIAGTPTLVWPPRATNNAAPLTDRRAVGIIRSSAGDISLVRPPMRDTEAIHPRVASAGGGGWHAIFVTGAQGTAARVLDFAQANLWYGRFDGRAWRQVTVIGPASSASLLPGMSSDLVATRQGLRFAYAFDRSALTHSNARGNQGVVLLIRRDSEWIADTLLTWAAPRSVQLVPNADGSVTAMLTQEYFEQGRSRGPALFIAQHDTGWSTPSLSLDPSPRYVASLRRIPSSRSGSAIISWQSARAGVQEQDLDWGFLTPHGTVDRLGRIAVVDEPGDQPAMFRLTSGRFLWLVPVAHSRHQLRVFATSASVVNEIGVVDVPLDNAKLVGVPLKNDRVLIISGGLGTRPSEPFATSYLTTIAVRCDTTRR
jgi:hypothetical protein